VLDRMMGSAIRESPQGVVARPSAPVSREGAVPAPPIARQISFTAEHHFTTTGSIGVDDVADSSLLPLPVIVQVTRRCNFKCAFCSETAPARDPTIEDLGLGSAFGWLSDPRFLALHARDGAPTAV
jgi:hypothetical protein